MTNPSEERQRLIEEAFTARFGKRQGRIVVKSPGRVNLIGEHTDYNQGFVLPAAIDRAIWFVAAPRDDRKFRVVAADMQEEFEFSIGSLAKSTRGWPNYLMGVIEQVARLRGDFPGCDLVFGGNLPVGTGLSSSAALECGFAFTIGELNSLGLGRLELARIGQKAEQDFVGVQCGIMDQFINLFGEKGKLLKLDCRSLDVEYLPFFPESACLVVFDTGMERKLSTSEYNMRRGQCDAGVAFLRKHDPAIQSLRDVKIAALERHAGKMDRLLYKRCGYVIRENERVLSACEALKRDDPGSFGDLMFQSHAGLRDEFEVSTPELDLLIEVAARVPGTIGARMMGGGFGGSTLHLVEKESRGEMVKAVQSELRKRAGREAIAYDVEIEEGTRLCGPL